MKTRERQASFTGWHMLGVMCVFFGVIISVNVTMATFARTSWTGLVVENSYVASQQFNTKMAETRAQAELGWQSNLLFDGGKARYTLHDGDGNDVGLRDVSMTFRRPVDARQDTHMVLLRDSDGSYVTPEAVADGTWLVEISAEVGREHPYRETIRVNVREGDWS